MSDYGHDIIYKSKNQAWLGETRREMHRHIEFIENLSRCTFPEESRSKALREILAKKANEFYRRILEIKDEVDTDYKKSKGN